MQIKHTAAILFLSCLVITGCSKKHQPQSETKASETRAPEEKKAPVKKVKLALPKVITVDDRAAKRSGDGRLYYDLEGHRYWRNYDDGKYYLYSRMMYNNPAFKPH
jgi:hypothetical protein